MKKTGLLIAGVCLLSGMVAWSADPVTSVNAVGVTKLNLPAGFSLIACPFNAVGGQFLTMDEMFGTSLPEGAYVYPYVVGTGYGRYVFLDGTWFDAESGNPAGTEKIMRGEGVWVYSESAVSNFVMAGEVPASSIGTNRIHLVEGFQVLAFAFPQEMALSASGLTPSEGDYLFKWFDGNYRRYVAFDGLWYDAEVGGDPVDVVLGQNEGFLYYSTSLSTNTWNQIKTYQWP